MFVQFSFSSWLTEGNIRIEIFRRIKMLIHYVSVIRDDSFEYLREVYVVNKFFTYEIHLWWWCLIMSYFRNVLNTLFNTSTVITWNSLISNIFLRTIKIKCGNLQTYPVNEWIFWYRQKPSWILNHNLEFDQFRFSAT